MSIKAFYFAYRLGSLDKAYPEWMYFHQHYYPFKEYVCGIV